MNNTFNIFLASNEIVSKSKFPQNNSMEFTINLPHRYRLGKCEVCLKSITIPMRLYNVYEDNELRWAFQKVESIDIYTNKIEWQKLKPGYYTIQDVIKKIQQYIDNVEGLVKISYSVHRKRVQVKLKEKKEKMNIFIRYISMIIC